MTKMQEIKYPQNNRIKLHTMFQKHPNNNVKDNQTPLYKVVVKQLCPPWKYIYPLLKASTQRLLKAPEKAIKWTLS